MWLRVHNMAFYNALPDKLLRSVPENRSHETSEANAIAIRAVQYCCTSRY